jgi:hypothetical protein
MKIRKYGRYSWRDFWGAVTTYQLLKELLPIWANDNHAGAWLNPTFKLYWY